MARNYSKNPRKISDKQKNDLERWLKEYGDLGCIVHNLEDDQIISGNQRFNVMNFDTSDIDITEAYEKPNAQGTIAIGYINFNGEKFPYRQVKWNAEKVKKAVIIANKAGGTWDYNILEQEWGLNLVNLGFEKIELEMNMPSLDFGSTNISIDPQPEAEAHDNSGLDSDEDDNILSASVADDYLNEEPDEQEINPNDLETKHQCPSCGYEF